MSSSFLSMNRTYERVVNITDMPDFSQYMKIKIKKEQERFEKEVKDKSLVIQMQ